MWIASVVTSSFVCCACSPAWRDACRDLAETTGNQRCFSGEEPFYSGLSLFQVIQRYRGGQHPQPPSPARSVSAMSSSDQEFFSCLDCSKVYKSKTSLNLHQRLECGKEPKFACPFCPKRCHQKGNLKVHIHSKHKAELGDSPNSANFLDERLEANTCRTVALVNHVFKWIKA